LSRNYNKITKVGDWLTTHKRDACASVELPTIAENANE